MLPMDARMVAHARLDVGHSIPGGTIEGLFHRRSRRPLPDCHAQPIDEPPCPDVNQKALFDVGLADALHSRPQAIGLLVKGRLDTEDVGTLFSLGDRSYTCNPVMEGCQL